MRAYQGGLLVGKPIRAMREHLPPGVDARIAAIFRDHQPLDPDGHTVIEPGDEVFVLAATQHIRPVMQELRRMIEPVRRVMIAGGGNIGMRVATSAGQAIRSQARSNATGSAPKSSPPGCPIPWCCTARPPTKTCWRRKTSTKPTCFSR